MMACPRDMFDAIQFAYSVEIMVNNEREMWKERYKNSLQEALRSGVPQHLLLTFSAPARHVVPELVSDVGREYYQSFLEQKMLQTLNLQKEATVYEACCNSIQETIRNITAGLYGQQAPAPAASPG